MVSIWNTLVGFKDITIFRDKPLLFILQNMEKNDLVDDFTKWSGSFNANPAYESIASNVWSCWGALLVLLVIFAVVAVIALKFVDKDKR